MGYALGVDLGTTYTAAATFRDGRVEIANLGNRAASVPSVVLLRQDEEVLTGEAADRRGITEPSRVAREFKRRVGDTTPIFVGGAPYSAEALMAKLLRAVVDEVVAREGGAPDAMAVSHPANWGPYKTDLLAQAVRLADLSSATLLTEPEAAALHYASTERVDPGQVVAVYDLGGGTFDAAVLRKTETGFEVLGEPEGIERLGGVDFDAAIFAHVARAVDGALEQLDEDDATALAAVARLRQDCVEAKEALSTDTDVSIPVLLPGMQTEVRLTRTEFEAMVRPALSDSIDALRRALRSAGVEASELHAVVLVGGSSRIPLVSQMVSAELGRPVSIDTHPKHAIALGAARRAAIDAGLGGAGTLATNGGSGGAGVAGAAAAGAALGAAAGASAAAATPSPATPAPTPTLSPDPAPASPSPAASPPPLPYPGQSAPPPPAAPAAPVADPTPAPAPAPAPAPVEPTAPPGAPQPAPQRIVVPSSSAQGQAPPPPTDAIPAVPPPGGGGGNGAKRKKKRAPIGVIVVGIVVILALGAGIAYAFMMNQHDAGEVGDGSGGEIADDTIVEEEADGTIDCPEAEDGQLLACINNLFVREDGQMVASFETSGFTPEDPELGGENHVHFFLFDDATDEFNQVTGGLPGGSPGNWEVWYVPDDFDLFSFQQAQDFGAEALCIVVATAAHESILDTGTCAPIPAA